MKKQIFVFLTVFFSLAAARGFCADKTTKIILLISEQNISGPKSAWWASEVDLSATEAEIAQKLSEAGYDILEPSSLEQEIKKDRAFRLVDLSEAKAVKLGNLSQADYVILGKAVASSGGKVPQSNMVSCFANLAAKLIRVKDGKVAAYLNARGNSAHLDSITGGMEALTNAAGDLAAKIIEALKKSN